MRVLLITTEYPPYIFGGGGIFMYNLVRGLKRYNIDTYILTRNGEHSFTRRGSSLSSIDDRIIYMRTLGIPPKHLWFQLQCKTIIEHIIKYIQPEIVHANSFSGGLLFKKLAKYYEMPRVITIHGYPRHYLYLSMRSIRHGFNAGQVLTYVLGYPSWHQILKLELIHSNKIVAVSSFLREHIIMDYDIDPAKIVYIPNGIDISDILNKTAKCNIDIESSDHLLVSGGRLYYEKGHVLLLYMMKKIINMGIKKVKLYIFGSGPLKSLLRRKIIQFNLSKHVKLLGRLTHEDALCLMRKASIVLLPSLYEIMPMTLLEAITLKKPVIALKSSYLEEILNFGFTIFIAKNIDELARKTLSVLNVLYENSIKEITNKNYAMLQKFFDISVVARQYVKLYKDLLFK